MPVKQRTRIKRYAAYIGGVCVMCVACASLYLFGKAYLRTIIKTNTATSTKEENVVAVADDISLQYVETSGVIVEYYAKRTYTDALDSNINASNPDLIYKFPQGARESIRIIAERGKFDQKNKIAYFEGNVFLEQGSLTVHAPEGYLDITNNVARFPHGGVLENKGHTLKSTSFEWHLTDNALIAENNMVYIVKNGR